MEVGEKQENLIYLIFVDQVKLEHNHKCIKLKQLLVINFLNLREDLRNIYKN